MGNTALASLPQAKDAVSGPVVKIYRTDAEAKPSAPVLQASGAGVGNRHPAKVFSHGDRHSASHQFPERPPIEN
jgi:hypothetical protein